MSESPEQQTATAVESRNDLETIISGNVSQGSHNIEVKPRETSEERDSRLRIAETDAKFKRWKDVGLLSIGTLASVVLLLVSLWIIIDDKFSSGVKDKAWGMVTLIIGAFLGYMTGKATK